MGKKILIVDDAMFMRKMIRKILMEGGYTDVEEAPDGETALENGSIAGAHGSRFRTGSSPWITWG